MRILEFLFRYFNLNNIFELLTVIGLCVFLFRRFLLKKSPVPEAAFKKVPQELFTKCLAVLEKQDKIPYPAYRVPADLYQQLGEELHNQVMLKKLLCSICGHLGINGEYIRLVVEERREADYAGNISTNGAFTTIRLELKPGYTLDAVIAVLAHEAVHLHLYYKGIYLKDVWENEILTDTATVYYGFGEYLYRGYAVMRGEFAFSYHKVGYVSQEDVKYLMERLETRR